MTISHPRRWAALIVLLILFGVLIWMVFGRKPALTPQTVVPTASIPSTLSAEETQQQEVRTQAAGLIATSKLFVERYGSYSHEANYQNVRDVVPLMTTAYAEQTQVWLSSQVPSTDFYGVTTRVITTDVLSQDETSARVRVSTQRVEEIGSAQHTEVRYQDIILQLQKDGDFWKIDAADWQS